MAVYFVTGKLGAGKTLVSVGHIHKYLMEGRRVATNLDISTEYLGFKKKKIDLIRLPDKPSAENMYQLGLGYEGDKLHENKSGLIVLDELGTWFNSRTWNEGKGDRKALLDWCLHARKLRWDIIFLVQDISIVDKQLREALCEHLVICTRSDRFKLFGMRPPKWHKAVVYYGDSVTMPKIDKWLYLGKRFYTSYDTEQVFTNNAVYEGLSSVLPYSYTKAYLPEKKPSVFKKHFNFKNLLIGSLICSTAYSQYVLSSLRPDDKLLEAEENKGESAPVKFSNNPEVDVFESFGYLKLSGEIVVGNQFYLLVESEKHGTLTNKELLKMGVNFTRINQCLYSFTRLGQSKMINCLEQEKKQGIVSIL